MQFLSCPSWPDCTSITAKSSLPKTELQCCNTPMQPQWSQIRIGRGTQRYSNVQEGQEQEKHVVTCASDERNLPIPGWPENPTCEKMLAGSRNNRLARRFSLGFNPKTQMLWPSAALHCYFATCRKDTVDADELKDVRLPAASASV